MAYKKVLMTVEPITVHITAFSTVSDLSCNNRNKCSSCNALKAFIYLHLHWCRVVVQLQEKTQQEYWCLLSISCREVAWPEAHWDPLRLWVISGNKWSGTRKALRQALPDDWNRQADLNIPFQYIKLLDLVNVEQVCEFHQTKQYSMAETKGITIFDEILVLYVQLVIYIY